MSRYRYRRYRRRYYRRRRGSFGSALRTSGRVARFGGRAASKIGMGVLKFGTRAASHVIVAGVRTGVRIVKTVASR